MKKSLKIILIISLVVNSVFIVGTSYILLKRGGIEHITTDVKAVIGNNASSFKQLAHYRSRVSLFKKLEIKEDNIVFMGDSLTQRGEWAEIFNNPKVVNRGIDSDKTAGLLNRIEHVAKNHPKKIFLLIGINDINKGINEKEILTNYEKIISTIKTTSPKTQIYIQSLLPVNKTKYLHPIDNEKVRVVNKELQTLAIQEKVMYIDLYSLLVKNDELNEEYTRDGIHLTGDAYMIWKNAVEQYVNE